MANTYDVPARARIGEPHILLRRMLCIDCLAA
jgi:hypothetical protein